MSKRTMTLEELAVEAIRILETPCNRVRIGGTYFFPIFGYEKDLFKVSVAGVIRELLEKLSYADKK